MDLKYFVLTKPRSVNTDNKEIQQVFDYGEQNRVFILPKININYYVKNGLFESDLIEWSKQFCRRDGVFLDVGGHTGTYALNMAELVSEVHVFEPQRATYYALCGSIALSGLSHKIKAYNYGLGSPNQVGEQTLNIVSVDGGGSSIQPQHDQRVIRQEQIEIRTLDEMDIGQVCFIKMDVEGNELDVLKGGVETIKQSGYPVILFESNTNVNNRDLFDYLQEVLGYNIISINGYANMFLAVHKP